MLWVLHIHQTLPNPNVRVDGVGVVVGVGVGGVWVGDTTVGDDVRACFQSST